MTLRSRLLLWLVLSLALLLLPMGFLTVREAQRAAQAALEQAALLRLGKLMAEDVSGDDSLSRSTTLRNLSDIVQEFGGVGFEVRNQQIHFTDSGLYELPEGLLATTQEGLTFRQVKGNRLWLARPGEHATLGLGIELGAIAELPQRLLLLYLGLGGGLALLAFAVGAWGVSRSLRPLGEVSQQLASRNPESLEPLPLPNLPEARPAVGAMNALMADLSAALERLKIQEQAAKRFAYGASHELRNPLTALKGYLEVLNRRPGELRAVEGALRESGRMESLLEGLLNLARLEGRANALGQRIDLAVFVPSKFGLEVVGQGSVIADPALLEVAIENLLKNARKHGSGLNRVQLEPLANQTWLWVYDQGGGFEPEVLNRAFEAFVKRDGSEGVGLGLALVAAIARVMDGQVRAENQPQGARVGIALPSA